MITSKDRIQTCVEKYGLPLEEAERIVKTEDVLLDINELRLKYDNPDMGKKYPDWLTPEEHLKMCYKTAGESFNQMWSTICTVEELASMMFIQSSVKLNTYNSFKHLKVGLVKIGMTIFRNTMRRNAYWTSYSLDDYVPQSKSDQSNKSTYLSLMKTTSMAQQNREFVMEIMSIKNPEVRELLIVCGYIVANISELQTAFYDVIKNSKRIDLEKLQKVLDQLHKNDEINQQRADNIKVSKHKSSITFTTILGIFKFDMSTSVAKHEIKEYLTSTGFIEGALIGG